MKKINDVKYIHLDTVDSTNTYAKKIITNCDDIIVVYADCQTGGRGRLGRNFVSNNQKGIYMSIAFKSMYDNEYISRFTAYTSTIVSSVIDEVTNLNTKIKWVNDIYLNNKKICGILTESIIKDNSSYVIVGIGLNVLKQTFDTELTSKVTTLEDETNIKYNILELIEKIVYSFIINLHQMKTKEYIKTYKEKSNVIGKNVEVNISNNKIYGKAIDIDSDGELVIQTSDEIIKVFSGEITKLNIDNEQQN